MPALQEQVEFFTSSNHEPPEEVICELQRLLREPLNELKILDSEIQRLSERRKTVETTIKHYDPIFAPIRRLPLDVLCEIFKYCLSEDRNPIISPTEAPILLTHICGSWRSLALSFPQLWSQIHISFTNKDQIHLNAAGTTQITQQRVVEVLRRRCEVVQEWLLRSGRCSLSFSLHYEDVWLALGRDEDPPISEISVDLCKILASVSHRWRHVEMDLPVYIYNQLLSSGLVEPPYQQFSRLTAFRLSVRPFPQSQISQEVDDIYTSITKFPNLEKLSINLYPPTLTSDWAGLSSLTIHKRVSLAVSAEFLSRLPGLVHLKLYLGSPESQVEYTPFKLPHLRTLYVTDANLHDSERFYNTFDAPELRFVSYRTEPAFGDFWYGGAFPNDWESEYVVAITSLLRKSKKLEALWLYTNNYCPDEMLQILESVPSITKFTYGPDQRGGVDTRLRGYIHWEFPNVFIPGRNPRRTGRPLLPHLETLELCCMKTIPEFDEDSLFEFITSRMDPSSSDSLLKRVKVEFYEPSRRDLMRDIEDYAKRLGILANIHLNIAYHYSPIVHHVTEVDYCLHDMKVWSQDRIHERDTFGE